MTGLRVYEKAAGGANEFAPSAYEAAYQAYFTGRELPLSVEAVPIEGVPAYAAQAVAIALNSAYATAPDAPSTVWLPMEEKNGEDGVYSGDAMAFFTAYRAYLTVLPGNMADRIEIYERPIGTQDWAYSPLTQAFEERPLHLPLPTEQDSPYASAAAIAVNQAYRKYLANEYDALKELWDQYSIGDGFSMIFFDRYFAIGFFKDDLLDSFVASYFPGVYNGEQRRIEMVNLLGGDPDNPYDPDYPQKALEELLIGQTMPLDPAQYGAAGDLAAYQVAGIILALNDAYQNSLAGQQ